MVECPLQWTGCSIAVGSQWVSGNIWHRAPPAKLLNEARINLGNHDRNVLLVWSAGHILHLKPSIGAFFLHYAAAITNQLPKRFYLFSPSNLWQPENKRSPKEHFASPPFLLPKFEFRIDICAVFSPDLKTLRWHTSCYTPWTCLILVLT